MIAPSVLPLPPGLISADHRALNAELHARSAEFGGRGDKWAARAARLARLVGCADILDYGCGKTPIAVPGLPVAGYDPAIATYAAPPRPADLVVCTDVLEHVEPDCLAAVLAHIRALTRTLAFIVIATRPAGKCLADGRDAHLIVAPLAWWAPRLAGAGFRLVEVLDSGLAAYWDDRGVPASALARRCQPGREFSAILVPQ